MHARLERLICPGIADGEMRHHAAKRRVGRNLLLRDRVPLSRMDLLAGPIGSQHLLNLLQYDLPLASRQVVQRCEERENHHIDVWHEVSTYPVEKQAGTAERRGIHHSQYTGSRVEWRNLPDDGVLTLRQDCRMIAHRYWQVPDRSAIDNKMAPVRIALQIY